MDHVLKAVILADAHIGADKFDTHPDRWDAPVREAFNWAVTNKADVVLSAGDFMHKRNPTVSELLRRQNLLDILDAAGTTFIEVDGNHDRPNSAGSHSALEIGQWPTTAPVQGKASNIGYEDVKIIALPWPRPVDYLNDEEMKLSVDEKIQLTRAAVYDRIEACAESLSGRPTILFGHAMLMYGAGTKEPTDPGLILGKDVTLELNRLAEMPGLSRHQIFMGHVHDPEAPGYVGSTQPTDWGDANHDKSFTELVIADGNYQFDSSYTDVWQNGDWFYAVKRHSYQDQLRLHDIVQDGNDPVLPLVDTPVDVARVTVNLHNGNVWDEAEVRRVVEARENYGRLDRVIVNYPEREAVRVETETPLADMDAGDAFETWMKQSGYSDDEALGPVGIFQELIESSK